MTVYVVANYAPTNITEIINIKNNDFVIAVDGAFDYLIKQKVKIDLVIGDMDSVVNTKKLKEYEQMKMNPIKDLTDLKIAIDYAYTLSNKVIVIGGIQGERIEHFLANLMIFNEYPNLFFIDENSKIYLLDQGKHLINKNGFVSFFASKESVITLEGFKYPLNEYQLKVYDPIGISNEVENIYGEITVLSGKVLVIETNKK